MNKPLHWNTISPLLKQCLNILMQAPPFATFRLVGGTALSLQLGHRLSVDIDLFSDGVYGSIDFEEIERFLKDHFTYVQTPVSMVIGMGTSYIIGNSRTDSIKLDVYYTDEFIRPVLLIEDIRMASMEDIIAMKVDIVSRGGRKKDFWDLHDLLDQYPLMQMIQLHEQRYPYSHDADGIKKNFTDFLIADKDFDPECLRGKHWELIKLDIIDAVNDELS